MTVKGPRSVMPPINGGAFSGWQHHYAPLSGELRPGIRYDLRQWNLSYGNGEFHRPNATLDVSDLDCGVYLITVEYENGTIYTGQIEFTE